MLLDIAIFTGIINPYASSCGSHHGSRRDIAPDVQFPWVVIQPEKVAGKFPDVAYTPAQQLFFLASAVAIDRKLAYRAGELEDPLVARKTTEEVMSARRKALVSHMKAAIEGEHVHYVSLLNGTMPPYLDLYNELPADSQERKRLETTIVGGTGGDKVEEARVLVPLSRLFIQASRRGIHDDLVDTGHSISAVLRAFLFDGDALTDQLTATFGQPYQEYTGLYDTLAQQLSETKTYVDIPIYKNGPLYDRLLEEAKKYSGTPWGKHMLHSLSKDLAFVTEQDYWLLGSGLDSSVAGDVLWKTVQRHLPDTVLHDPKTESLLRIQSDGSSVLTKSRVRMGAFAPGLIALKDGQFPKLVEFYAQGLAERLTRFVND